MKNKKLVFVGIIVLVIGLAAIFLLNINNEKKKMTFPYDLDDGKLTVQSIFQSSIDNPDCHDKYEDDIASLEIVNNSDQLLKEADITVETDDGTLTFHIESLPAKETMWVFESKNQSIDLEEAYYDMSIDSQYTDQSLLVNDLDISLQDYQTEVTVTNKTSKDIQNISIDFHTKFEGVLYGGKTYNHQISQLKANESVKVNVIETFMGTPEAVQINIMDKGE